MLFIFLTFSPEDVDNESQTRKFQHSFFTFLSHDIWFLISHKILAVFIWLIYLNICWSSLLRFGRWLYEDKMSKFCLLCVGKLLTSLAVIKLNIVFTGWDDSNDSFENVCKLFFCCKFNKSLYCDKNISVEELVLRLEMTLFIFVWFLNVKGNLEYCEINLKECFCS